MCNDWMTASFCVLWIEATSLRSTYCAGSDIIPYRELQLGLAKADPIACTTLTKDMDDWVQILIGHANLPYLV
jgi:hypothetical protein